jgi:hypothetical protein
MEMEDHDFQVVRKNLNILSVLIVMLAFTNAQINKLNFLGIDIDLDSVKLYQALFIGYAYFIWRYWTKLNFMVDFWQAFNSYYMTSDAGVKEQHTFERYKQLFISKSERLEDAIKTNKPFHVVSFDATRLPGWPMTRIRLAATFASSGRARMNDHTNYFENHDITVSWFYVLRKLIKFSLKEDKFGDYLFPFIPVIINALFFLLKRDWQGSIYLVFG